MKSTALTALLGASCCTAAAVKVHRRDEPRHIPTSYESAVMGRRILALSPLGTLATIFPVDDDNNKNISPHENRPAGVGGMPHGLMEYISDCEGDSGNPTLLAITVETSFKNIAAGSNVSLAVQWTPPHPPAKRIQGTFTEKVRSLFGRLAGEAKGGEDDDETFDPAPYSAANLPRFSILGHVERISGGDDLRKGQPGAELASCFVKSHPDARHWLPGNRIHDSYFVRLVVDQIYWVGGFGDRAFIGWIPVGEWTKVTREEWEDIRLPGEKKGWKEWSVQGQRVGGGYDL